MQRFLSLYYNDRMILLIGPSASGKTEISKDLSLRYGMLKVITHTTRAPRPGEIYGVDYYFVQEEDFLQLEKRGFFVETTLYNGHHYGCSKNEIADDKVVVVDPNGLASFLALKDPTVVTFFLKAAKKTRLERMKKRGDSPESVKERILNDEMAFSEDKLKGLDFIINVGQKNVSALTDEIYKDYLDKLKERGIENPNIAIKY